MPKPGLEDFRVGQVVRVKFQKHGWSADFSCRVKVVDYQEKCIWLDAAGFQLFDDDLDSCTFTNVLYFDLKSHLVDGKFIDSEDRELCLDFKNAAIEILD